MGDPRIPENNLGPLISDSAADLVEKRILMAKADGAKIVLGGKRQERYITPTILSNVTPFMDIMRIETFGPVISFLKVNSTSEAIKIINSSDYGLQTSIFTSDEGAGINLGRQLEVGTVQINCALQRGFEVYGIRHTLEAMSRLKLTVLNQPH